jgi:hypothetical protein
LKAEAFLFQMPSEQVFRAILTVPPGKEELGYFRVVTQDGDKVPELDILHSQIRGIDALPFSPAYNIANTDPPLTQEIFALLNRFISGFKGEIQLKNLIQDGP